LYNFDVLGVYLCRAKRDKDRHPKHQNCTK
jgi:hypothetical protein